MYTYKTYKRSPEKDQLSFPPRGCILWQLHHIVSVWMYIRVFSKLRGSCVHPNTYPSDIHLLNSSGVFHETTDGPSNIHRAAIKFSKFNIDTILHHVFCLYSTWILTPLRPSSFFFLQHRIYSRLLLCFILLDS